MTGIVIGGSNSYGNQPWRDNAPLGNIGGPANNVWDADAEGTGLTVKNWANSTVDFQSFLIAGWYDEHSYIWADPTQVLNAGDYFGFSLPITDMVVEDITDHPSLASLNKLEPYERSYISSSIDIYLNVFAMRMPQDCVTGWIYYRAYRVNLGGENVGYANPLDNNYFSSVKIQCNELINRVDRKLGLSSCWDT